jgi:hypothetical protein
MCIRTQRTFQNFSETTMLQHVFITPKQWST